MTPKQIIGKLNDLGPSTLPPSFSREQAEAMLLELLTQLGYDDVVQAYIDAKIGAGW